MKLSRYSKLAKLENDSACRSIENMNLSREKDILTNKNPLKKFIELYHWTI